jgi:tetratricopeptide (TPR) repeat protein
MAGRYRNSLECHSFLGLSYTYLKMYDLAEYHFNAVFNGSEYFALNKNIFGIYTNLAVLYFNMGRYEESISYCKLAMNPPNSPDTDNRWLKSAWHAFEQPMYAACIYVEVHKCLNDVSKCKEIFDKYLTHSYQNSVYYHYLHSLYLSIFHFDDDAFYNEMTSVILPFYKNVGYLNIYNKVRLLLIKHLKAKRKYKEANKLYEDLLG